MPVDANEHNRRIAGAMLKETWWAYLKRIFHRDILCTQRYDANGAIQFWPKRFYDRWFVGALGEETFSPHNIPNMKPGHMRFYERTRAFSSIFNASLSFTDLLPLWMKGPISPPVREWFVGWPKIRNPMIFSGAVEPKNNSATRSTSAEPRAAASVCTAKPLSKTAGTGTKRCWGAPLMPASTVRVRAAIRCANR
jgi:hypothetical protein